ncbi:MAG: TonB-dependent siderophore receptor, partial [Ramlibacter sp.]
MAQPSPLSQPHWPQSRVAAAIATLLVAASVHAQETTLKPVLITGKTAAPTSDITGFGDFPLKDVPISATIVNRQQLDASGARRLSDLAQFDASVSDAYNAPGYWDFISIRGFTLDNRYNYRREGLPISAETTIPLDNKDRIEILKGTSGIQAGTSAPGGLVNYVVKRPTELDLREVKLEYGSRSNVLAAADLGGRFGADRAFGYRFNIAQERLRPLTYNLDGERSLVSLAGDWRISRESVLEAEVEWSHKSQASQVGFSLLGNTLPPPAEPRLNLNNQPWSQPSVFDATTGTLRFTQNLSPDWRWSAQLGTQRLKTDDFTAFPYGCGAEGNYDRYCSDGTFDFYDFRSENERRRQDAASLNLKGKVTTGSVVHDLSFGLLASKLRNRFQAQAFNPVDPTYSNLYPGNVDGTAVVPENPAAVLPSTNRDERSLEFSVQDATRWSEQFTTWVGLRHTRLTRESILTDGTDPVSYDQHLTTPWVAASFKLTPWLMAYASHGRGMESQVAPANPIYTNAGRALPALKSRQTEVGLKADNQAWQWGVTLFDISRPVSGDTGACSLPGTCTREMDGEARHRGLELAAGIKSGAWKLDGGATFLDAKREGSVIDPTLNGKQPTNVPEQVFRAAVAYQVPSLPGLTLQAQASHESSRAVLPDNSIMLPSWTRFDAAVHYETKLG